MLYTLSAVVLFMKQPGIYEYTLETHMTEKDCNTRPLFVVDPRVEQAWFFCTPETEK